jgi:hypothetical protein
MSLRRQVTCGVITRIEPKQLHILVTAETDHEGRHYVTLLQVGFTNYRLSIGDTLSWSTIYNGVFSSVMWWRGAGRKGSFLRLYLVGIESQKITPSKDREQ